MNMNTQTELSSPITSSTPVANVTVPDPANAILAVMQGYGYSENEGIARRQQRALALLLQGHYTAKDLALNPTVCPLSPASTSEAAVGEDITTLPKPPMRRGGTALARTLGCQIPVNTATEQA